MEYEKFCQNTKCNNNDEVPVGAKYIYRRIWDGGYKQQKIERHLLVNKLMRKYLCDSCKEAIEIYIKMKD